MAQKRRRAPRERGNDDSEENLRGKLRELEKELREERRYSRSLEKKLSVTNIGTARDGDSVTDDKFSKNNQDVCKKCGEAKIKYNTINAPHKKIVWAVCESCNHKEKVVGNDK
jgi:hypothetical protein